MTEVMSNHSSTSEPHIMRKRTLALILVLITLTISGTVYGILQRNKTTQKTTVTLRINGLVQNPLNLTIHEIQTMPKTVINAQLICVDFPSSPIASGNWTGVQLAYLLQQAKVNQTAIKIAFHADDGYTTDLTVQDAMKENIIIAYELDDQPLTEGLRLIVPGRWGYKWISQLTTIELVDYDFKGTWESRGYSDQTIIP